MKWAWCVPFLALSSAIPVLSPAQTASAPRPRDPWVFRSVLDQNPRMITIALSSDVWLAYDAQHCSLYKAWDGDVKLQGAVYTAEHGPQPVSEGPVFEVAGVNRSVWSVVTSAGTQAANIRYRGYRFYTNTVELKYEVTLPSRRVVTITETPEAWPASTRMTRTFRVEGLPAGTQLELDLTGPFVAPGTIRGGLAAGRNAVRFGNGTYAIPVTYGAPVSNPPVNAPTPRPIQEQTAAREPGVAMRLYDVGTPMARIPRLVSGQTPNISRVIPSLNLSNADFGGLTNYFLGIFTGFIVAPTSGEYELRLSSDDGSRLSIRDTVVIDHDGLHGATPKTAVVKLDAGENPFQIEYFENEVDATLRLEWKGPGMDDFEVIPTENLRASGGEVRVTAPGQKRVLLAGQRLRPGDRQPLTDVHPSYNLTTFDIPGFEPRVGGLAFLPDGSLVVCTWDAVGGVYIVRNGTGPNPKPTVTRFAAGLAEPLGVSVVNGDIYVLQKQELTKLIDHNKDGVADEYFALANGWGVTANFHEFAFGLVHRDGHFYAALATAIDPGGRSTRPQNPDRGRVIKINDKTGEYEFVAQGLRTPNGIGPGAFGLFYIADNQGDWLPSSTIVPVIEGAFYGNRSVDFEGTANLPETPPVVWLPQNEIGNSPSQPAPINDGPYKGQMIHGDVTHGGLKRVFVERVDGVLQGAVFRFTQGLMAGINRTIIGPDGGIYVGGIGSTGNWGQEGKKWFGLQRLNFTGAPAFEMLRVSPRANGVLITFTEPLADQTIPNEMVQLSRWRYERTEEYGGPKLDETQLAVKSLTLSGDRRSLFVEADGMKEGHVVYVHLSPSLSSESGRVLWSTEAWYTLNKLTTRTERVAPRRDTVPNQLSAEERRDGFRLLFDGTSLNGWSGWRRDTVPGGWTAAGGNLTFTPGTEGGDIRTAQQYGSFELRLQWRVAPGGNSGIMYRATEDRGAPWETGPEMQVLDDDRHPDGTNDLTSAGAVYGLYPAKPGLVRPAGVWNDVRLVVNGQDVEHWLNGHLIAKFTIGSEDWIKRISESKFASMPDFGKRERGYIVLQDHGDKVEYRTIRIKALD